jgi:hypothetical protein
MANPDILPKSCGCMGDKASHVESATPNSGKFVKAAAALFFVQFVSTRPSALQTSVWYLAR